MAAWELASGAGERWKAWLLLWILAEHSLGCEARTRVPLSVSVA